MQFCNGYTHNSMLMHGIPPYNKRFPSDDLNDVKVLHCVTEEGKEFQTEHVLGTKE